MIVEHFSFYFSTFHVDVKTADTDQHTLCSRDSSHDKNKTCFQTLNYALFACHVFLISRNELLKVSIMKSI